MANKIYVGNGFEICDLSGVKNIEQLKRDFNCPDLVDVTAERVAKEEANKLVVKENADKEALIQAEIREQAIATLKAKGNLDVDGKITAQGKAQIASG